jgi:hypothetical protein
MYCKPLSPSPPQDLEVVDKLSDTYWSAQIKTKTVQTGELNNLTEWFKIPKDNLKAVLHESPQGPLMIKLETIPKHFLSKLFEDTNPIISIQTGLEDRILRQIHDLS